MLRNRNFPESGTESLAHQVRKKEKPLSVKDKDLGESGDNKTNRLNLFH